MDNKLFKRWFIVMVLTIIISEVLTGCSKEPITPGNYVVGDIPQQEPINWQSQFTNGGTIPTWTSQTYSNELVGTKWVLWKVSVGAVTTLKNDTIRFVTNNKYQVNGNTNVNYNYTLYNSQNSVTLTFAPFQPMNYMLCSTNELGVGFASGQEITGVNFENEYNVNTSFKAWFHKIP